jgi:hypothetical protein
LLFRGLSRIVALNSLITPGRSKEDIAASIGESDKSLLFDGEYFHEAEKEFGDLNASKDTLFELLTNLMARVVLYAEEISVNETDMTRILFNYKLGQEVLGDGRRKAIISIEKNGEKILQREMCRHLLENNILAYGREFGRSQIDLYTKDVGGEEYAIEVKLRKTKPNEEFITKSLAQLLNYMDQLNQPRGILVIYNCTEVLITSPRRWFQGRIWVLPINLCVTSPSQRKSVLDIEEAKGSSEFVRCRILGITGRRPPGRGKKLTLPSGTPSRK